MSVKLDDEEPDLLLEDVAIKPPGSPESVRKYILVAWREQEKKKEFRFPEDLIPKCFQCISRFQVPREIRDPTDNSKFVYQLTCYNEYVQNCQPYGDEVELFYIKPNLLTRGILRSAQIYQKNAEQRQKNRAKTSQEVITKIKRGELDSTKLKFKKAQATATLEVCNFNINQLN